ncbi:MAG TPA: hypothetical protein VE974_18540 [Thermoanaerobaculia bacterium]|nr:hypothetical protein [Thermoanaerobaculia bacterium]
MTATVPPPEKPVPAPALAATAASQLPAWLLSSAGASALLVAFGYLVELSRDQLLGIALRDNVTLAEYGVSGARFLVNVITLAFRLVALHPLMTLSAFLIVSVIAIAAGRLSRARQRKSSTPGGTLLQLISILLLFLGKAALFDIPPALIENVLIEATDPHRQFDASPVVNSITQQYWKKMICAHATRGGEAGMECEDNYRARRTLENLFLLNAFITVVMAAWTLSLTTQQFDSVTKVRQACIAAARAAASLSVLVAVIALPYQYGKLVAPTTFKQVSVHFKPNAEVGLNPGNPGRDVMATDLPPADETRPVPIVPESVSHTQRSTPLEADGASSAVPGREPSVMRRSDSRDELTQPALLLTGNANVVTLYYIKEDLIRELSRSDIEHIAVRPGRDVLQLHMDRTLPSAEKR